MSLSLGGPPEVGSILSADQNQTIASQALHWVMVVALSFAIVEAFGNRFEDGPDSESASAQIFESGGESPAGRDIPIGFASPVFDDDLAIDAVLELDCAGARQAVRRSSRIIAIAPKRPPPPQFG